MSFSLPINEFIWPVAAAVTAAFIIYAFKSIKDMFIYVFNRIKHIFWSPPPVEPVHGPTQVRPEDRFAIKTARIIHNSNGFWFRPGEGNEEWFQDFENGPVMVVVPAGKFLMGSPESEQRKSWGAESPQHEVTIPKPFAVGRCAVTRGEFAAFIAAKKDYDAGEDWRNPGFAQDDSHPVVCVSWYDAQAYVAWLSTTTGAAYRLPSEAEWEYACRAGTKTAFWWGTRITPEQANYNGSAEPYLGGGEKGVNRGRTWPAKSFDANPWGLYNVHGNAWEWCEDLVNGSRAGRRVIRGGSWCRAPQDLRSAFRGEINPRERNNDISFRVARTIIS